MNPIWSFAVSYICLILLVPTHSRGIDKEMTIKVKPGSVDCFYETIIGGDVLDLEYQVINGEHGELDIDFAFYGHTGNLLKSEQRTSEGVHRLTLTEPGDYKFCWDNSFSRFSTKSIFFAIFIENPTVTTESSDSLFAGIPAYNQAEELYEMKVEDIKSAMDKIRSYLTKSRFMQDSISAGEARDRNTVENNYSKINTFSCISVIAMLATGIFQVVLLRSLFDDRSKFHKLWHKESTTLPRY